MERTELIRKFWAGIFLIIGAIGLVAIVLALGQDKGLAQAKFHVTVLFRDVRGLGENAPVRLSGVNVGSVAHIDFLEEENNGRRVQVILSILSRYRSQLEKNTPQFSIQTEGILGEKLVVIDALGGGEPVDLTQPMMGEEILDVQELAEVFAKAAESFTKTSEDLSKIDYADLSKVLSETAQSVLTASESLNRALKEMGHISRKIKRLLNRVEERIIDGTLFKVF